jgi:hypothetical protein
VKSVDDDTKSEDVAFVVAVDGVDHDRNKNWTLGVGIIIYHCNENQIFYQSHWYVRLEWQYRIDSIHTFVEIVLPVVTNDSNLDAWS